MSALSIILAAAIVVSGDGPEKVSGEMERGLDLSGKWEGSVRFKLHADRCLTVPVAYQDGKLTLVDPPGSGTVKVKFIDQGKGKCRWRDVEGHWEALCIYKRERGQLFICRSEKDGRRPTTFTVEEEANLLLILYRVKSHK